MKLLLLISSASLLFSFQVLAMECNLKNIGKSLSHHATSKNCLYEQNSIDHGMVNLVLKYDCDNFLKQVCEVFCSEDETPADCSKQLVRSVSELVVDKKNCNMDYWNAVTKKYLKSKKKATGLSCEDYFDKALHKTSLTGYVKPNSSRPKAIPGRGANR